MAKEKRLSTSQDPCDETNSVKQTKCFYEYIFDILQCNLPWRLPVNKGHFKSSESIDFTEKISNYRRKDLQHERGL